MINYVWNTQGTAKTVSEILNYIMKERNFTKQQMLDYLKNIPPYNNAMLFKNMDKIIFKIKKAIKEDKKIYIFGDYDSDGVNATYILYRALKFLGANVYYKLPHRLKDGYGIQEKSILQMQKDGAELIITVDNGIASIDAINKAIELGIEIIVTDHHQPQEQLPNCLFLDAHVPGSNYPFLDLCGAGVAFKLASVLIDDFENCEIYNDLLVSATIGTISDVMPIYGENRRIIIDGLRLINSGYNIGIQKLLEVLNLDGKEIDSGTIGFKIGPCINAAGRLDTPLHSLNLLLSDDDYSALKYANKLNDLNEKRKTIQKEIAQNIDVDNNNKVIISTIDGKIAGIAGILASNIAEKYMKPCFIFHNDKTKCIGSARTFGNFPVIECLNKSRDIIISGGGHNAACGLAIAPEMLPNFQESCNNVFDEWIKQNPDGLIQELFSTCEISDFDVITEKLINNINKLKPFGEGNPEPVFITKDVNVENIRIVGKNKNVIQFVCEKNFRKIKCVGFESFMKKFEECKNPKNIDIMYKVGINEFPAGIKNVQLTLIDFKMRRGYYE